ncbi:hypothetical protein H9P43_005499 [Blastocladiella emersonii ATCC 22665]|nr:hypothetical protein H9P43_005499 [Blastocladiella emersonii ATCC 22665]
MSSKAKSAAGKKKTGKKDDGKAAKEKTVVDDLTQRLTVANAEIDTLKREMGYRDETVTRLRDQNAKLKSTVEDLERAVEDRNQDRRDLTADSNTQYRKLQIEMQNKVNALEAQIHDLKATCETTATQLSKQIAEYNKMVELKDAIIEEQSTKISCMATEFESMLNETMEKVARKIEQAANQWNGEVSLSPENQRRYQEFST